MFISEGDDESEFISVGITLNQFKVRVVSGYGPQTNAKIEKKHKFWSDLDHQVSEAFLNDSGIVIQMDSNAHAGETIIKNDPNIINNNGEFLKDFLQRNPKLSLINGTDLCEGSITRFRKTKDRTEESILDIFIVCDKLWPFVTKMVVDSDRRHPLVTQANTYSDHYTTFLDMSLSFQPNTEPRSEYFNFRNIECQEKFKQMTEDNKQFIECFQTNESFEVQSKKFMKTLNNTFQSSFKKIRNRNKVNISEENKLFAEKLKLINEQKKNPTVNLNLQEKIDEIEEKLSNLVSKKNRDKVVNNFKSLDGTFGDNFATGMWNIKKKIFPKNKPTLPTAKLNINGMLVTSRFDVKRLYLDTFTFRLRDRPIKTGYEHIQKLTEDLCRERLMLSNKNKTNDWTMDDLEEALAQLKKNKARDPQGLANEIFRPDVAGTDLKKSILMMFNKIKETNILPHFFKLKNITAIPKGKTSRTNLEDERGIVIGSVFNSILMTMIYDKKYDVIDENMSDSNIGSRKNKSTRSHIFVVNGAVNESIHNKEELDIIITDYKQAYDSLFLDSVLLDLYESGVQDDHLNLIQISDSSSLVAVNTPVGVTDRREVTNKVLQGEKLGPIKCSNTIDKIGKQCIDEEKYLHTYRNEVKIPPLALVDDVLAMAKCGTNSVEITAFLNAQTNLRKLQFGINKCHKMHIGRDHSKCPDLYLDCWKLERKEDIIENIFEQIEVEDRAAAIEEVESDSYLGSILSANGSNKKNIQARVIKGLNAGKTIIQIMEEICFGPYSTEVFIILRNSLMLSTLLSNCESMYRVTKQDVNSLEDVDNQILRQYFQLHSKTPTEFILLELGLVPVKYLVIQRRIMFLFWILQEDPNCLIYRFFQAQVKDPKPGDWCLLIKDDFKALDISLSFDDIKNITKNEFKKFLKDRIEEKAFQYLMEKKKEHSKMSDLKYDKLRIQNYLKPESKLLNSERNFILQIRSRMLNVKNNFKSSWKNNLECRLCLDGILEDQKHILLCEALNQNCLSTNDDIKYEEIFSENIKNQIDVSRRLRANFQTFNQLLLEATPCAPPDRAAVDQTNSSC